MKLKDKLFKDDQLKWDIRKENEFKCKNCGHMQFIPKSMGKALCDCCGIYVFRDEKDEFKFRLKEKLKK